MCATEIHGAVRIEVAGRDEVRGRRERDRLRRPPRSAFVLEEPQRRAVIGNRQLVHAVAVEVAREEPRDAGNEPDRQLGRMPPRAVDEADRPAPARRALRDRRLRHDELVARLAQEIAGHRDGRLQARTRGEIAGAVDALHHLPDAGDQPVDLAVHQIRRRAGRVREAEHQLVGLFLRKTPDEALRDLAPRPRGPDLRARVDVGHGAERRPGTVRGIPLADEDVDPRRVAAAVLRRRGGHRRDFHDAVAIEVAGDCAEHGVHRRRRLQLAVEPLRGRAVAERRPRRSRPDREDLHRPESGFIRKRDDFVRAVAVHVRREHGTRQDLIRRLSGRSARERRAVDRMDAVRIALSQLAPQDHVGRRPEPAGPVGAVETERPRVDGPIVRLDRDERRGAGLAGPHRHGVERVHTRRQLERERSFPRRDRVEEIDDGRLDRRQRLSPGFQPPGRGRRRGRHHDPVLSAEAGAVHFADVLHRRHGPPPALIAGAVELVDGDRGVEAVLRRDARDAEQVLRRALDASGARDERP